MRSFIAVDLTPLPALGPVLRELSRVKGLKAVDGSLLHVTLKFLGDTREDLVASIGEVMRSAVSGISPFEVEVVGSGVFPPKGGARVVWAGLEGAEPMGVLARRLEEGLEPLGFPPEGRSFRPHLTLARVKDPAAGGAARQVAESFSSSRFGTRKVEEIVLKKSVLRPQGPEYSDLLRVPLA
jgi:2'-5' RNA ligase